ncbi:MAG: glycoside hydrolase [Clostridia bacterium]|nr:glycoside hydrolase [Clostridia bacterium]
MQKIIVNAKDVVSKKPDFFNYCVGSGRAYESLGAENQRHMKTAKDECGFKYLRFHGLLHDDMGVCKRFGDGSIRYNFQYIDLLFDYMLDIGIRPFIELGFMPRDIASGKTTLFFWQGNVTMPTSLDEWAKLVRALLTHCIERYGIDEVLTWPIEVWNEPNLRAFFDTDHPFDDYMLLYEASAKAVKEVDPRLQVGGPATAGCGWIPEFISACVEKNLPLDFITTHHYDAEDCKGGEGFLDVYGTGAIKLCTDAKSLYHGAKSVYDAVKASALPNLKIHFTEWGITYCPRDPSNDSYFSGVHLLRSLKDFVGLVDSMSFWVFSDIFEEGGAGPEHFHGGFGLQNIQGIKKPTFIAYKYLNMLSENMLQCEDDDCFCTASEDSVEVLFWNYSRPQITDSNNEYFARNLKPLDVEDTSICISGIEDGEYTLTKYGLGYGINDAYTEYKKYSFNSTLSKAQVEEIKSKTSGAPISCENITVCGGVFEATQKMRENDVYLYVLKKA